MRNMAVNVRTGLLITVSSRRDHDETLIDMGKILKRPTHIMPG
jgi:hypothetical protein